MKKINFLIALSFAMIFGAVCANAEPRTIEMATATTLSTTGASNVTTNIAAVAGRRILIWGIYGTSDKSGSVISVDRANAQGTTGNYTTKATFAVGAASANLGNGYFPIYCGDTGYALRLRLDSTTKNNIMVNYQYE